MAHAKKSRMSRLQSDKTYNKKSSLTFSTHTKIAIPTMTDIEISHIEHTSRVNEWQAGQEVGKKQASKDESEAKKCCLCRFIRCILCSWILIIIAGGIAAIVAWQLGAFETDAYAFTDSSTNSELCNGLASNCDWKVNEIMFPGVHNAMSSKANGFVGWNNLLPLEVRYEVPDVLSQFYVVGILKPLSLASRPLLMPDFEHYFWIHANVQLLVLHFVTVPVQLVTEPLSQCLLGSWTL
jgi:hypothetical protein